MPKLLSGSTLRRGGSGEFIELPGAQPQLPESPTTSTGYTVVTNSLLQTRYASSLGNVEIHDAKLYSSLPDGSIRILSTGTTSVSTSTSSGTLVVEGGVGIGRNLWVNEDIHVNGLTIGRGFEGINNIAIQGTATNQTSEFNNGQASIVIGYDSLVGLDTSYRNIAIGTHALSTGTNIRNSIAIGDNSLRLAGVSTLTNSNGNIAIGANAGKSLITGEQNVILGFSAAAALTTGTSNIIIGHEANRFLNTGSGIISIGGDNIVDGLDNQVNIGNVFYFDGAGYADINAETTIGLGTESTGTDTGSLVVVGGAGIFGNINVGGTLAVLSTGTSTIAGTLLITEVVPSDNPHSGALQVAGGAGIAGDVFIGGKLSVAGPENVTLSPQSASVYIQPSAGGTVEIYPEAVGNIDNVTIGSLASADATFNTLTVQNSASVNEDIHVTGDVYSATGIADEGNLLYTPKVTVSAGTPPDFPRIGDIWIDSTVPAYLQYIKDGTNTFWIQIGAI